MKTIGWCLVIIAGMATADFIVRWGTPGLTIDALIIIVSIIAGVYLLRLKTEHSHLKTQSLAVKTWLKLPTDLLEKYSGKVTSGNISKNMKIIQNTLSPYGSNLSMGDVNIGPTVTQYLFQPAKGVTFQEITRHANTIALELAQHPIRIDNPIPGKNIIGIELPNKVTALVSLREILESEEFKSSKSNLTLPLGRDVAGIVTLTDLKETPNILMSGATGSGKSNLIHAMIVALLYQNTPEELRFILDDSKRVEDRHYNDIPHLLYPVIYDTDKTLSTIQWAVEEAKRRQITIQAIRQPDIESYNRNPIVEKLPHIVMFIDEFSDCMAAHGKEIEAAIIKLSKVSHAVGIHLVIATSRPSTDVITDKLKASIPCRIGLAQADEINSMTIMDYPYATKLLGRGDILFLRDKKSLIKRIQAPLVTDNEIKKVTDFLKTESISSKDILADE